MSKEATTSAHPAVTDGIHAEIAPTLLRLLLAEAAANGPPPAGLLRGSGLQPTDLAPASFRVSFRQCAKVLRRFWAARPVLGTALAVGGRFNALALGYAGVGLMTCDNHLDMLDFLIEFQQAAGFPLPLSVHRSAARREVRVQVTPSFTHPDIEPFLIVYTLAALNQLTRQAIGVDFRPLRAELALPNPLDAPEYERKLGCSVGFGARCSALHLPLGPVQLPAAEPYVANRMRELLHQAHPQGRRLDYSAAVIQILRRSEGSPPCLAQIAALLNLSERSLRRRLQEDGVNYRDLIGESRRQQTMALLTRSDASMMEVALQTGYSGPRSLRRAVQRWTGLDPRSIRRADWSDQEGEAGKPRHAQEGGASSSAGRHGPE